MWVRSPHLRSERPGRARHRMTIPVITGSNFHPPILVRCAYHHHPSARCAPKLASVRTTERRPLAYLFWHTAAEGNAVPGSSTHAHERRAEAVGGGAEHRRRGARVRLRPPLFRVACSWGGSGGDGSAARGNRGGIACADVRRRRRRASKSPPQGARRVRLVLLLLVLSAGRGGLFWTQGGQHGRGQRRSQ